MSLLTAMFDCEMMGHDGRARRAIVEATGARDAAETFCRQLWCGAAQDWVRFADQNPVVVEVDGEKFLVTPLQEFRFEAEEFGDEE